MTDTDLISIIVPVYNAEAYLRRCVDSILAQTHHNIEVILIDDESADHSGALCDHYAALDSRVSVVHRSRGTLGSARNAGLSRARGEYIGFVDADDYISPVMYESLYQAAVDYNADIAQTGVVLIRDDGVITDKVECAFSVFETPVGCLSAYLRQRVASVYIWNKLYHRRIFEARRMVEDYLFEDTIEIFPSLWRCQKFVALEGAHYFWSQNTSPNSITRGNIGQRQFESLSHVLNYASDFILTNAPQFRDGIDRLFCELSLWGYLLLKRASRLSPEEKNKYRNELVDRFKSHYARLGGTLVYKGMKGYERVGYALFAVNPELGYLPYKLLEKLLLLKYNLGRT